MTTELTKKDEKTAVALIEEFDLEARAGEAQEGLTQDDYAMPFLALLQSNSPQVKKSDPKYLPNASEGMLMNTVDHELFEAPVTIIPCAYRRVFVEWKVRENSGGGYVREHPVQHGLKTFVDGKNRDIIEENGNELKDTRYWYVLVVRGDGSAEPAVIGMTRTQIKPARVWQNLIGKPIWPDGKDRGVKVPPAYVWTYKLGIIAETKGENSYWNYTIERSDPVLSRDLFILAQQLHDSVVAGTVREAVESVQATESDETSDEAAY